MNRLIESPADRRWLRLIAGTIATVLGGLGVHVFLQQTLQVPFPAGYPAHAFIEQLDQATTVFGLLVLLAWAAAPLRRLGTVARWLALFVIYAMLRESFRGAWMEGVVTTAYAYPFLTAIPRVIGFLILTLLCVIAEPRLPRLWHKALAAGVIYAASALLIQPAIAALLAAPLAHVAYLQHDEVYGMPYGAHVLLPAYITYLEPAIACIVCAALVWTHLDERPATAYLRFVMLVLVLRRSLFPPFIYALYEPRHPFTAFASAGQFSLETIALATLSALTWRYTGFRRTPRASARPDHDVPADVAFHEQ
jgi:hypothetical protein